MLRCLSSSFGSCENSSTIGQIDAPHRRGDTKCPHGG
jgi:hypothetical protein